MLNVTGTRDRGAKGQDRHWKVEPYEFAPDGDKFLAVPTDADHYLGGVARADQSPVPEQRVQFAQTDCSYARVGGYGRGRKSPGPCESKHGPH